MRWHIGIILGEIICNSSDWQHIQRLKITILGANWQLFRLERIANCSYFILSTQSIKFYLFVMKIKKFLLPIWWYNRGSFPLGNKYFGVFVLNGIRASPQIPRCSCSRCSSRWWCRSWCRSRAPQIGSAPSLRSAKSGKHPAWVSRRQSASNQWMFLMLKMKPRKKELISELINLLFPCYHLLFIDLIITELNLISTTQSIFK